MSIIEDVKNSPMSRWQVGVVVLCLVISIIDGFDLLVISYVGLVITGEWGIEPSRLGVLLSGSLIGLAFGALFLAPLADRFGRRKLILAGLAIAALGMAGGAVSRNFEQLLTARIATGIATGVIIVCLLVVTTEYSNYRRRGLAVGMLATGFAVGGVIAGAAAAVMLGPLGWQSLFVVGAVLAAALFVAGLRYVPESLDYLLVKRPPNAFARVNGILASMGRPQVAELPPAPSAPPRVALEALFRGRNATRTVLIWIAMIIAETLFYFASLWTPALLQQSGLSTEQGIGAGLLYSVGSLVGGLLFGALASWVEPRVLAVSFFALGAAAFVLYSFSLTVLAMALIVAALIGVLINGVEAGMGLVVSTIYPAEARATGVGVASAVSRLGAVVSPMFAGVLVQAGVAPTSMFQIYALPALIGMAATGLLLWVTRGPSVGVPSFEPAPADVPGTASGT